MRDRYRNSRVLINYCEGVLWRHFNSYIETCMEIAQEKKTSYKCEKSSLFIPLCFFRHWSKNSTSSIMRDCGLSCRIDLLCFTVTHDITDKELCRQIETAIRRKSGFLVWLYQNTWIQVVIPPCFVDLLPC